MKKSLLALAALTAFAGAASAQSSVTLFGVVDVNARQVDNDGAGDIKSLSTDGMGSSRLGFRGVEDLGGGLRAGFWLEAGLGADVGTMGGSNGFTTVTFNRRSTVSLMGGFGEIRLGRDYTPDFWNHTVFDPFGTNGVANSLNLYSATSSPAAQTSVRTNNAIGYFLPAMGGLYGQLQVAAGEGLVGNKHLAGRIGWAAGPVNVAVAYGKTEVTPAVDYERVNVGASFKFGFMTLMGQYIQGETSGGVLDGREVKNYLVGGIIPFGASQFKFSYVQADNDVRGEAQQIGLGYIYSLSKRTSIYAHAALIDNDPGANFVISGGPAAVGTGFKSKGYELGINHTF